MRKVLVIASLLTICVRAFAAPFLVCDPYPAGLTQATAPVSFILKGFGLTPLSVPVTTNQDGTIQLHYDLASLGNGSYTVICDAVNVFGGVSADSLPFTFIKGVPAAPGNLRIIP